MSAWHPTPARLAVLHAAAREQRVAACARRVRVLAAAQGGASVAEVARALGVTCRTVQRHRAQLRAEGRL